MESEPRNYRVALKRAGFERDPWMTRGVAWGLPLAVALLVGAAVVGLGYLHDGFEKIVADVATLVFGAGAFAIGLIQWKLARAETSFERFYDRLRDSNDLLGQWKHARAMFPQFWESTDADFQQSMYIFTELDTLEYCFEKYRRGFMAPIDAYRGLRTFRSRCASAEFRARALRQAIDAGYQAPLVGIVRRIVEDEETRQASTAARTPEAQYSGTPG